jgi:hypothetical protein
VLCHQSTGGILRHAVSRVRARKVDGALKFGAGVLYAKSRNKIAQTVNCSEDAPQPLFLT